MLAIAQTRRAPGTGPRAGRACRQTPAASSSSATADAWAASRPGRRRSVRSRRRCRPARPRPTPASSVRPARGAATRPPPGDRCRAPWPEPPASRCRSAARIASGVPSGRRRGADAAQPVELPVDLGRGQSRLGDATTQCHACPGASTGLTVSPRPVPSAVPPCTRNGTSDPIRAAMAARSSRLNPVPHSASQATRAAAASALPPASPAASGICLRRCSRAWAGRPAARPARVRPG